MACIGFVLKPKGFFLGQHKVTKNHTGIVQEKQGIIFYLLSVVEEQIYNSMLYFYKEVCFVNGLGRKEVST